MIQMQAYTDYPFTALGDEPYKSAPVREIEVLSYDGDKYCVVLVEGIEQEVKSCYVYKNKARCYNGKLFTTHQLSKLPKTEYNT